MNRINFVDLNKKFETLASITQTLDSKFETLASITQSEAAETQKQLTLIQKQQQKCESMVNKLKPDLS